MIKFIDMVLSAEIILLLFFAAIFAGWVDTIAGGGGLIALPALLLTGVPVEVALATNKLQGSCGTFISTSYFIRKKLIRVQEYKLMIIMTFLGSASGSALVLYLRATSYMTVVLPLLLFAAGCYFLFSPRLSDLPGKRRISYVVFSLVVAPLLGFYDGFFGPGFGSFMSLAFVALAGYSSVNATAHTKMLNFTSNIAALSYFIVQGEIFWAAGFVMIVGQIIGTTIAARMVIKRGVKLIKPILVLMCFAMSITYVVRWW